MSPEIHPNDSHPNPGTEEREEFVPRRGPFARKFLICAAALLVTVAPVACTNAYADQTAAELDHSGHNGPQELFPVGGRDDANSDDGNGDDGNAQDGAAQDGAAGSDDGSGDDSIEGGDPGGGDPGNGDAGEDAGGNAAVNDGADNAAAAGGNGADNAAAAGGNGADNAAAGGNGGAEENNGLDVLGRDCSNSDLETHNGFQEAPRCVETAFGEVAAADKSPSLLITESPETVQSGETFTLQVSTRNLVRDRFLGAAAGGYYLESSFLDDAGIQRGHFHTACRMLDDPATAPDAAPDPEFFLATQDNGGGAAPDTVTVTVTGMPRAGLAQCAVWAGDGSHRIPMMQRANQTPAFDAVRITVQ